MNLTKNFEINILDLVKDSYTVEPVNGNMVKVSYVNKGRGSSPKAFILPKKIILDEEFIEAIAMYLGDGKLSADLRHLGFTSIDCDMVRFMFDFFSKRLNVHLDHFCISINCKKFHNNILRNWANALNIPKSKFRIQQTLRSRNPSCDLQISGTILRIIFGNLVRLFLTSNFLQSDEHRRAFLRGLFAAEGSIGINRQQNYIVCINFCLGSHEKELVTFLKKALNLENISYSERKGKKDSSWNISITNWKNYYKLWKIDLFKLNVRKEMSFINKLKITKFCCNIRRNMLLRLFQNKHMSQRQLAFMVGAYPALFCNVLKQYNHHIDVEYLINLAKIASVNLEEIKKNILSFRVNRDTKIDDKEFIDFIFDLKNFT